MFPETNAPIEEHYVVVLGKASQKVIEYVQDSLPLKSDTLTQVLFIDYAIADYSIGAIFTKVFKLGDPSIAEDANCKIVGITQQFNRSVNEISQGWKTICAVEFTPYIPSLIQQLPEIDSWFDEEKDQVCLSTEATWKAILNK